MIDWDATYEQFGYREIPSTKRPKVICKCDKCDTRRAITIRVKSRIVDNDLKWLCHSCAKLQPEVSAATSARMREQWANGEYRDTMSGNSRKLWADKDYRHRHSEAVRASMKHVDMSTILHDRYKDAAARDVHRVISARLWQDEAFRNKVAAGTEASAVLNGAPSSLHNVLSGYLDDLHLNYTPEFKVGPYNFDFCIHRDCTSILVEINGDYWHNRAEAIERDKRKASYASLFPNQYKLLVIWEYEFYTNGRVLSRLKESLGIEVPEQIDFDIRSVVIRDIDPKEARVFLTQYHYSGSLGRGGVKYGAYCGDKLIAVVVSSPVVRKEVATRLGLKTNQVAEISRFCIHPQYHKRNFASWFLGKVVRMINTRCIVSFSDTTFGHSGTIYKAANFTHDGIVKPDYWYVDQSGWVMHKKTLYEHARSLRMTESEFATKYKYKKIFGGEKHRFIYWK